MIEVGKNLLEFNLLFFSSQLPVMPKSKEGVLQGGLFSFAIELKIAKSLNQLRLILHLFPWFNPQIVDC